MKQLNAEAVDQFARSITSILEDTGEFSPRAINQLRDLVDEFLQHAAKEEPEPEPDINVYRIWFTVARTRGMLSEDYVATSEHKARAGFLGDRNSSDIIINKVELIGPFSGVVDHGTPQVAPEITAEMTADGWKRLKEENQQLHDLRVEQAKTIQYLNNEISSLQSSADVVDSQLSIKALEEEIERLTKEGQSYGEALLDKEGQLESAIHAIEREKEQRLQVEQEFRIYKDSKVGLHQEALSKRVDQFHGIISGMYDYLNQLTREIPHLYTKSAQEKAELDRSIMKEKEKAQNDGWIPVQESSPNVREDVYVAYRAGQDTIGRVSQARLMSGGWFWCHGVPVTDTYTITHWMPIPPNPAHPSEDAATKATK